MNGQTSAFQSVARSLIATVVMLVASGWLSAADPLLEIGCLDVTQPPYLADPTGTKDSTAAIQRAVNDARDRGLVCFFPEGTYVVSDTISCEQQVRKLDRPRNTDGRTQHYWDLPHRIVMFGSTRGKRPVLKLSPDARGFGDPANPKVMVWIWAQTRDDAPGSQEPEWGKEQPNISFNHYFKGIDLDIRGHAGAIGIRHSGSQGSALLDSTIQAEGAYAGMNNCCGQGGGTYNIQVLGGRYGIVIEPSSRFPILTACSFQGQTQAAIRYARGGSQVPTLLVGCRIEPAGDAAVDFTTERAYAGISLVDCMIALKPGSVIAKTRKTEHLYLEDTWVKGAAAVYSQGGKLPAANDWTRIARFSSHTAQGVNLLNGVRSEGEVAEWHAEPTAPDDEAMRHRHYRGTPSFEDADAVTVKSFGAKGDGTTDDTPAFQQALAAHDKIFVPKGSYRIAGNLALRPNTQLFGLTSTLCNLGGSLGTERFPGAGDSGFSLSTADDADASPGIYFLGVRGRIDWRSGRGSLMLAPGQLTFSGQAGGRFYGVMAMRRPWVLNGIRNPTSFYALNVERVTSNPQSEIRNCSHIRVYYFKVEAGTVNAPGAADANTPGRISQSDDVRVYCMYGNVRKLVDRPMLEIVDSTNIVVSQLKAFQPGDFPHLRETFENATTEIPSSKTCALFERQ
jgi:hypothetical protein